MSELFPCICIYIALISTPERIPGKYHQVSCLMTSHWGDRRLEVVV